MIVANQSSPQAFLRFNILNFQINNHQRIDLFRVQTQVELKEISRSNRDTAESRTNDSIVFRLCEKNFRTSTCQISDV